MTREGGVIGIVDKIARYVGIGLLILGTLAIVAPHLSGLALAFTIGLILVLAGGLIAMFGLSAREAGKGSLPLVIGVITALAGLILVVRPSAGLAVVYPILIAYLLIRGCSELMLAMRLRSDEGRMETAVGALVSIAAGLVLWTGWPISGARAVGLLVGASLISSGLAIMRIHRAIETTAEKLGNVRAAVQNIRSTRQDDIEDL